MASKRKLMTNSSTIVQRIWNCYHVLRNDGASYDNYLEQLTRFPVTP